MLRLTKGFAVLVLLAAAVHFAPSAHAQFGLIWQRS